MFLSSEKIGFSLPLIAFFLKGIFCVVGVFVILPFGGADGLVFERFAWEWSQNSLWTIITGIDVSRSYVISSITAVFYHLMGRDVAIPIFINGILGVLIFYFSLVLAESVWGKPYLSA